MDTYLCWNLKILFYWASFAGLLIQSLDYAVTLSERYWFMLLPNEAFQVLHQGWGNDNWKMNSSLFLAILSFMPLQSIGSRTVCDGVPRNQCWIWNKTMLRKKSVMNMKQDYVAQEISDEYETRLCCARNQWWIWSKTMLRKKSVMNMKQDYVAAQDMKN